MSRERTIEPIFEGETFPMRARVSNPETLFAITQADVEEILLRVFDLDGDDISRPIHREVLEVSDHVSDSLITDSSPIEGGYNVYDDPPNVNYKNKIEGGHRYRFQWEIRRTEERSPIFLVLTVPVLSVW